MNSKFGMLDVVIDRFNEDDRIWLLDSDFYSIGHLPGRMFNVESVAPTGDATKFVVLSEWTLIMKAPKASAWVADLNGS